MACARSCPWHSEDHTVPAAVYPNPQQGQVVTTAPLLEPLKGMRLLATRERRPLIVDIPASQSQWAEAPDASNISNKTLQPPLQFRWRGPCVLQLLLQLTTPCVSLLRKLLHPPRRCTRTRCPSMTVSAAGQHDSTTTTTASFANMQFKDCCGGGEMRA